jgi:hypothetical protein
MAMQLNERIRGDHAMGMRPFQEALHKSSPKADHVKRPLLPLFSEPLLQV